MFRTFSKPVLLTILLLAGVSAEAATFEYRIARARQVVSAPAPSNGDMTVPGSPATGTPGATTPGTDPPSGGTTTPSAPAIEPSAATLNFGRVATNSQPITRQVLVTNTGSAPLVFSSSPYLTGSSSFGMGLSNCGQTLAPGTSCNVEVTYYPTAEGTDNASIYFRSNAPALEVPVGGEGFNPVQLQRQDFNFANNEWYKVSLFYHLTVEGETPDYWLTTWEVLDPVPPGMTISDRGIIMGTPIEGNINFYLVRVRVTYRGNSHTQQFGMFVGDCAQLGTCYTTPGEPTPGPGGGDDKA